MPPLGGGKGLGLVSLVPVKAVASFPTLPQETGRQAMDSDTTSLLSTEEGVQGLTLTD